MLPYRVVLEGSWPVKWNDVAGFYATRIVLAESSDEAGEIAKQRLLADLPNELADCPTPQMKVDTFYQAEAKELLQDTKGFTFYSDVG